MKTIYVPMLGMLLCLACESAQAKKHLTRDELNILSSASVAVVYMDTDRALWPYINQHVGVTPVTMIVADVLNQRQLDAFNARTGPYQDVLAKLGFPVSNRKAVQDALASVASLQKIWTAVIPDPHDHSFLLEQGLKTKADVVIFIRPRLELNDDADDLYLVTMIDIETLDATGKSLNHYGSTELSTDVDVDDAALPTLATQPGPDMQKEDARAARLFADDGAAFRVLYAKLIQQAQQQIYYYFSGNDTLPPAATTHASGI
jgi:hypothetical protein